MGDFLMDRLITRAELDAAPIFEVVDGERHYKIWANGRTEGFNPEGVFVVNRIAALIPLLEARHLESVAHLDSRPIETPLQGQASHMEPLHTML